MPREPKKPIALTMGEPTGIGGELTLKAWKQLHKSNASFFCIDNPERLQILNRQFSLSVPIQEISTADEANDIFPNALPVLRQDLIVPMTLGKLDPKNGTAVIDSIKSAVELAIKSEICAVVTNPIHKAALYEAGFSYPGHTEFLAALAGNNLESVMMLACEELKVVPITIHLSLQEAISSLSQEKIITTVRIVDKSLREQYNISSPRLALSGLNPHAGENGKMGDEEQTIIKPAIEELQKHGLNVIGPLPADTMFHKEARDQYDVALCMYHDQALIPIKTLDFHGGVNVTLGLPFIRTSPDHGTALDIAEKGVARPDSLINAIKHAYNMAYSQ